jgi:peptidoglycan/xylan/chitin deacetylase (PgdA/CDA1 family)
VVESLKRHGRLVLLGLGALCIVVAAGFAAAPLLARAPVRPQPAAAAGPATPPPDIPDDAVQDSPSPLPEVGPCVTVPILYYHYIRVNPVASDRNGFKLSVTPENFAEQMSLLQAEGAHPVTLADVMAAIEGQRALPSHPVVLTFDDGHDDFATRAAPVLLAHRFQATAFVVPGFFGMKSYMTEAQVQQVAAEGFVIGAHTMHHVSLVGRAASLARVEIEASRSVLQSLTHQPVLDFAYPYGRFDAAVEAMVREAGFREAVSTVYGDSQCEGTRWALRRVEVTGYDTLATFARRALLRDDRLLPAPSASVPTAPASHPSPPAGSPSASPGRSPRLGPTPSTAPSPTASAGATPAAGASPGGSPSP